MSKDWQARFQELAVQQQDDARRSAEAERVLCRTIVRLCTACDGLDVLLDPHLNQLKVTVRNGYQPSLAEQLNALGDALVGATEQSGQVALIDRLAARLVLPAKQARKLRAAWDRVASDPASASDSDLDAVISLLGLVSPGTDADTKNASAKGRGGLLGRLIKSDAGKPPNVALAELLARIAWPESIGGEIAALRQGLSKNAPDDAWMGVVERLSDLIVKVLQDSRAQVAVAEAFLAELTDRLGAIDAHVSREAGDRDAAQERGEQLSAVVQGEMDELNHSLRDSTDLSQLKTRVSASLDRLQQHLEGFLDIDRERYKDAVIREAALRDELQCVEQEAEKLRQQVASSRDQANTDALTGLANRRAWDIRLAEEVARFRRFGGALSLVVFDLDNFKQINDRFGHKAGDKALKVIATLLGQGLRETDYLARYGGEEFVLLLPGASGESAQALADKLRGAVAGAGLHTKGEPVPLTVSGGVATMKVGEEVDVVFERADKAMYQAKADGKNRIVLA